MDDYDLGGVRFMKAAIQTKRLLKRLYSLKYVLPDMSSHDNGFIVVRDPTNPNRPVRARLVHYQQTGGQDHEYTLDDGTRIRLRLEVDSISRIIDPDTNRPAVNPTTGEPVFNISWGVRVNTIYSERALGGNQT